METHRYVVQAVLLIECEGTDREQTQLQAVKQAFRIEGREVVPGVTLSLGPALVLAPAASQGGKEE